MMDFSSVRSAPAQRAAIAGELSQQRQKIVAEARRWVGTPYHDCADIRGVGVDCGMLLVRVFVDLGFVPPFDPRPYPRDWMMHNDEEKYLGWVKENCGEVETPQAGDIAVFRFGRCYSHGGIITAAPPLTLVHAYVTARCVIEEKLAQNSDLTKPVRKVRFFSLWAGSASGRLMPERASQRDASGWRMPVRASQKDPI